MQELKICCPDDLFLSPELVSNIQRPSSDARWAFTDAAFSAKENPSSSGGELTAKGSCVARKEPFSLPPHTFTYICSVFAFQKLENLVMWNYIATGLGPRYGIDWVFSLNKKVFQDLSRKLSGTPKLTFRIKYYICIAAPSSPLGLEHLGAPFRSAEIEYLLGIRLIRAQKLKYYWVHSEPVRWRRKSY